MATPFSSRDAKLSGAIDRAFGELFTFTAYATGADVDSPKAPDASRPAFTVKGVWEAPSKSKTPQARGSVQDDNAHNWSASMPSVSVDDSLLQWAAGNGDRITREFDGATYQIITPVPDGMGRTTFLLSSRKRT